MKPETLEALLIDRAMGELPAEVAELLDAHLIGHPEAALQAGRLATTLQLARQAVAVAEEQPRRSPPVASMRQAQARQRRWSLAWGFARLAACAVFGLAVGWYGHARRPSPIIVAASQRESTSDTMGFWSQSSLVATLRERQLAESRAFTPYRLRWESPVKMPRIEEDL